MITFLNWLCLTEFKADCIIAEKHCVEMYVLHMTSLRRTGNIKLNIDRLRNHKNLA